MHYRFYNETESENQRSGVFQLLFATFNNLRDRKQLLILPLTIWSGLQQGFMGADFTAVSLHNKSFKIKCQVRHIMLISKVPFNFSIKFFAQ